MNQIASYELLQDVLKIPRAGFEPALPKETDLKSVALDHSAKDALFGIKTHWVSLLIKIHREMGLLFVSLESSSCGARSRDPKITLTASCDARKSLMLCRTELRSRLFIEYQLFEWEPPLTTWIHTR